MSCGRQSLTGVLDTEATAWAQQLGWGPWYQGPELYSYPVKYLLSAVDLFPLEGLPNSQDARAKSALTASFYMWGKHPGRDRFLPTHLRCLPHARLLLVRERKIQVLKGQGPGPQVARGGPVAPALQRAERWARQTGQGSRRPRGPGLCVSGPCGLNMCLSSRLSRTPRLRSMPPRLILSPYRTAQ